MLNLLIGVVLVYAVLNSITVVLPVATPHAPISPWLVLLIIFGLPALILYLILPF